MINLILLTTIFVFQKVDFYFWPIFFISLAVIRYLYNKKAKLLIITIILTLIFQILPFFVYFPFELQLYLQLTIIISSVILAIKAKFWRKDLAFFIMEPGLFLALCFYLLPGSIATATDMYISLGRWLSFYFYIQLLFVLIKVGFGLKFTLKIEGIQHKWRRFAYCLMNIKANIGFRDMSLITPEVGFIPNINENVIEDLKKMNIKLEAIITNDDDYSQLKEKAEYSRHFLRKFKQKYNNSKN